LLIVTAKRTRAFGSRQPKGYQSLNARNIKLVTPLPEALSPVEAQRLASDNQAGNLKASGGDGNRRGGKGPSGDEPDPPRRGESHKKQWNSLPQHSGKIALVAAILSLLVHVVSGGYLSHYSGSRGLKPFQTQKEKVKIRVIDAEMMKKNPQNKEVQDFKKMLEMPQLKTERPDTAKFVGTVDHKAEKETKLPDNMKREKAANAGVKGDPNSTAKVKQEERPEQKQQKIVRKNQVVSKSATGKLSFEASDQRQPRNDYEAMLPSKMQDLPGQLDAGYQDYIDDKIDIGDRIDINTTEYRYIGYFSSMRKSIELVWIYPDDAIRRGMQGETVLEFAIDKSGRVSRIRVIKSSGYEILDKNMIQTLKMAAPFSPLPPGWKKNRIIVTGSFRYMLSAYGSH
jgi:protein TonB